MSAKQYGTTAAVHLTQAQERLNMMKASFQAGGKPLHAAACSGFVRELERLKARIDRLARGDVTAADPGPAETGDGNK